MQLVDVIKLNVTVRTKVYIIFTFKSNSSPIHTLFRQKNDAVLYDSDLL